MAMVIQTEPFFAFDFPWFFLCHACTFAKWPEQQQRQQQLLSQGATRGCENSSLAFQKLNCIFPKKGQPAELS